MTLEAAGSQADVQHLCRLAGLPRATDYRHLARRGDEAGECELRDLIQRICLKHRFYGYRQVTAVLRRQGMVVNAKKVQRLMREDNLLAQRKASWLVSFMHYDLGYFDLEQKTLQPLDNPFGTRLSPMS